MTEVEKVKYKICIDGLIDRYDSVSALAYKMWPLCTLNAVRKIQGVQRGGEMDRLDH